MKFSRFLLILIAFLLFAGLITYSALKVSYPVDKKPKTELFVTERSLTHSVIRGPDGNLITPKDLKQSTGKGKACPT